MAYEFYVTIEGSKSGIIIYQYADADTDELEDVSFVFRKIEIENKIGKIVAVDDTRK